MSDIDIIEKLCRKINDLEKDLCLGVIEFKDFLEFEDEFKSIQKDLNQASEKLTKLHVNLIQKESKGV